MNICQSKESAQVRSVDPAEENDADDEGEIWYNPIPEDEEPEISNRPFARLLVQAPQRRPRRGGDAGHLLEVPGEKLGGGGSADGSQGNGSHSSEALQLHRHTLVCKPQEEGGASRAAGMAETSDTPSRIPSFSAFLNLFHSNPLAHLGCCRAKHYAVFVLSPSRCSYTRITNYSLC